MSLINIFIASILTQNIVLTKFLGICPFVGTSENKNSAIGMGLAVTFVITISSILTFIIYHFILVKTNTTYLRTIIFILVIASMVQVVEIIMKKFMIKLHNSLGIYLPLITTNCAVLGVNLLNINNGFNFLETIIFSIGSSLGFMLVIYVFSTIREKIEVSCDLKYFRGYPIAFITAAIMSLVFSRYM